MTKKSVMATEKNIGHNINRAMDEYTWHPYGFRCVRKETFHGRLRSLFTTKSSKASCIVTRQVEVYTSTVRITAAGLCVLVEGGRT